MSELAEDPEVTVVEPPTPDEATPEAVPVDSTLVREHPAHRAARLTLYLGVLLVVAGAGALYAGYRGAATNDLLQAQFPFFISGGLLGLALMLLGGIALAVFAILKIQADLRQDLDRLRDALEGLGDTLGRASAAGLSSADGLVIVAQGASSYHRPDCRLVARARRARPRPRDEVDDAGLTPCRICKP